MRTTAPAGGKTSVDVVIRRKNGAVENWGKVAFSSELDAWRYALLHPVLMLKRRYWAWQARSQTRG